MIHNGKRAAGVSHSGATLLEHLPQRQHQSMRVVTEITCCYFEEVIFANIHVRPLFWQCTSEILELLDLNQHAKLEIVRPCRPDFEQAALSTVQTLCVAPLKSSSWAV